MKIQLFVIIFCLVLTDEEIGDRTTEDNQLARDGQIAEEDKTAKYGQVTEDDQMAKDEETTKEDQKITVHQLARDDQMAKDDQVVVENEMGQGDDVAEDDTKAEDKMINEEEYISELCRKYSAERPIPEEEAELFLKELTFPIPTKPHLTLSEDDVAGKRIFVIGDVHGCYDHLLTLLHIADIDKDPNALLIFVGDIINKGPKSLEVLNFVRSSNSYSVMGNHERAAVRKLRLMKMNVGYEPKASKQWLHGLNGSDYEYLQELPYTISIPSLNAIIVHGGLLPGKPLEEHTQDEMLLMRNIIVKGNKLKATKHIRKGQLWGELWKGPRHVYFGHHALEGLQRYPYATGLDTGCVYHGSLTGVFLTGDKKLVSIKNEGCRNEEVNQSEEGDAGAAM